MPLAEEALQVEDGVGRIGRDVQAPAGHALRVVVRALVVEHADVGRPVVGHLEVEPAAERVLRDVLRVLQLHDVEVGVGRSARQDRPRQAP